MLHGKKIRIMMILMDVVKVDTNFMAMDIDMGDGLQLSLKFSVILTINLIIIVMNVIKILLHKDKQIILKRRSMK